MAIGEHKHYETMFRVIHEECELAVRNDYRIGIITFLKQEAEFPTLKNFRSYVYKMCDLALKRKE